MFDIQGDTDLDLQQGLHKDIPSNLQMNQSYIYHKHFARKVCFKLRL